MKQNQASLTALMTAFERGYHAHHDHPRIFDDSLAYRMLTEEERVSFERQFTDIAISRFPDKIFASREAALVFFIQNVTSTADIVGRARYTEEQLETAAKNSGLRQYVILGAGLDTFAFRRTDLAAALQVFEIDHPATQAFKQQRIAALGWKPPANLHFVPIDFTHENLPEVLRRSAYDPTLPAFFSWLGVTYYLPQTTIFHTLRLIAEFAAAGSSIIFDYYDSDAFIPGKASRRMEGWKQYTLQAGEPIITGLDPASLAASAAELGLEVRENLSPAEIENRYFGGRTDGYHATEHTHFAWLTVK